MSKRGQEATSNEGSPMAKARSINLVMRDTRSEENSSQSLGYLVNPVNTDERQEVTTATGNCERIASGSEVEYSQVSRQENAPMAAGNGWREGQLQKQRDEIEHSHSNSTRNPVLGASTQELRNMKYTNHQYMTKVFQFLQRKLGTTTSSSTFLNNCVQNKCIDMGNVHVLVNESFHPSWAELFGECGNMQEHQIRRD